MLSRISLLTNKASYQQLLKLTSTHHHNQRLSLICSRRSFTTKNEETSTEKSEEAKPVQKESQDDYNLDEVPNHQESTTTSDGADNYRGSKGGDRKRYTKREYQPRSQDGGAQSGGLFKKYQHSGDKREPSYNAQRALQYQQEQEAAEKPIPFEEYSQSKSYQLQLDIYNLIKEKIGTSDKTKIQKFYSKMQQELRAEKSNLKINDVTVQKIQALILEHRTLDDKKLYEDSLKEPELILGERYSAAAIKADEPQYSAMRRDTGDSNKEVEVERLEYEEFVQEQIDKLAVEIALDQNAEELLQITRASQHDDLPEGEEEASHQGKEEDDKEEIQSYNEIMQEEKEDMIYHKARPLDFKGVKRISTDITNFNEQLESEQFEIKRAQGLLHVESDQDLFNEQHIKNHLETIKMDKEGEEELEDAWNGLQADIYQNMREDLKSQYEQARSLMKINQQLRTRFLYQVKNAKQVLAQTLRQREKLVQRLEIQSKDFQSDIIPTKVFDFIQHDKKLQARAVGGGVRQKRRTLAKQYMERQFDQNSKEVEVYNNELNLLLSHYRMLDDKTTKKEFIKRMDFVVNLLFKNQIISNIHTKARLFEFAVISRKDDYANQMLQQISADSSDYPYSPVDPESLNQFFNQSIKQDNFNGLGHLSIYVEKFDHNIGNWNLSNFKNALDFYLNKRFDLTKVLIFTKFYTHYSQCRLRNENVLNISKLSDDDKFSLNAKVFNNTSLVDMRSTFSYLVEHLGTKQAIDPITKEDAMWRIVEFFTKPGIADIANFGQTSFNSISEKDISAFIINRIEDAKAFEKITQVLINLKGSQTLHNDVIQGLKEYISLNNGQLPVSFEAKKIRQAYLRIKSSKSLQLSEKNLEYFLYLFKTQNMWSEIIDLCENFERLSGSSASPQSNEIKNYYLSDTILSLPSNDHYHNLVKKIVYDDKEQTSAGYLTAMTKAHFKDGAIDHALKFFESEVQKIGDIQNKREGLLIAMFDSAFSEVQSELQNLSYSEYKNRYLDVIKLSTHCLKEGFAVAQLKRIFKDKDYDEIETLFQLYLVQKQENIIFSTLPQHLLSSVSEDSVSDEVMSALSDAQINELQQLKQRKLALKSKIDEKDAKHLIQVQNLLKNEKLSIFDDADEKSADEIQQVFNLKSKDEIDEILKRTELLTGAAQKLRDENSNTLEQYHDKNLSNMSRAFKANIEAITAKREVPDRNIDKTLEQTYYKKGANPVEDYFENEFDLKQYNDYMLSDEIYDEGDPIVILGESHDQTLSDMKEELLQAINNRKSKVLAITLKMLNKVQDQNIKSVSLSSVSSLHPQSADSPPLPVNPSLITDSLAKYNMLLNDPRSPVYSAMQTIAQYKGDKGVVIFNKLYRDIEDFFNNRLDIPALEREQKYLEDITAEVQKSQSSMKNIQSYLIKEQQEINKEMVNDHQYAKWTHSKEQHITEGLEKRIKQLYEEFKNTSQSKKDMSREDKLSLMRDIFSVEYDGQFASNEQAFPAFYAQDMLVFGIENDIVEAVRLGEKMMSENGYTLSLEMQKAVKNYMVENSEKYQKAIKKTGPIDNTTLYRRVQAHKNDESIPSIFSRDDPYWETFIAKNSKRTQQWRVPSHLAWNHKPDGIAGEVVNLKHFRENEKQLRKFI